MAKVTFTNEITLAIPLAMVETGNFADVFKPDRPDDYDHQFRDWLAAMQRANRTFRALLPLAANKPRETLLLTRLIDLTAYDEMIARVDYYRMGADMRLLDTALREAWEESVELAQ